MLKSDRVFLRDFTCTDERLMVVDVTRNVNVGLLMAHGVRVRWLGPVYTRLPNYCCIPRPRLSLSVVIVNRLVNRTCATIRHEVAFRRKAPLLLPRIPAQNVPYTTQKNVYRNGPPNAKMSDGARRNHFDRL